MMTQLIRAFIIPVAIMLPLCSLWTIEEFTATCMGTKFKILIDHEDPSIRKRGAKNAFNECQRLNQIFSDYLAESEISKLSDSSHEQKSVEISQELFEVLQFSLRLAQRTDGAFDPTLGHLSRTWRIARFRKKLPSTDQLKRALDLSGYQHLRLTGYKKAKLEKKGIILDLGGVAKGYAADRMMVKLNQMGITKCLIDAGGDLSLGDPPAGREGWVVKIGNSNNTQLPQLNLSNCSVATSGDLEQFIEFDGKRYSHILDSQTGLGMENQMQVTFIARSGMIADAYATSAISLGPEKTFKTLVKGSNNTAYFIIGDKDSPQTIELKDPHFDLDQ
jgi:thiamine biosynthesis lipoprotein